MNEPAKISDHAGPASSMPMMTLWRRYEKLLAEWPLLIKALTSCIGFALGDILTQCFIQRHRSSFSAARLLRLATFGFLLHGPSSHVFYGMLDQQMPGTSAYIVVTKVAIDQLFWCPCFSVLFFGYTGALEMKGVANAVEKIKAESLNQVLGSWHVWPAAHAMNFRLVPTEQRVLFINCIQVAYNCFLSILANRDNLIRDAPVHLEAQVPPSRLAAAHARARRHTRWVRSANGNATATSGARAGRTKVHSPKQSKATKRNGTKAWHG